MKKKRRKRKGSSANALVLWGILLFVLIGVAGTGIYFLVKKSGKSADSGAAARDGSAQTGDLPPQASGELKKAIADLDKSDPGWRLNELMARRPKIDPAKNGAIIASNVASKLPNGWSQSLGQLTARRNPVQPFNDFEMNPLRLVMRQYGAQTTEARKIALMPRGQFALQIDEKSPIDTLLPEAQQSRNTAQLLMMDAFLQTHDRDGSGACTSAYALFEMTTYFRDDPIEIVQLVRIAESSLAISALERAMTCANVPDNILETFQKALIDEANTSPLLTGLRGDRALFHAMIVAVAKREAQWQGDYAGIELSSADHAQWLAQMNALVDLARSSFYDAASWRAMASRIEAGPRNIAGVIPAAHKVAEAGARWSAALRSAGVAIAAERFRRVHNRWPKDLGELTPKFIKSLPKDSYGGGPLRYAIQPEGIAVYSKAGSALDQGGAFNSIGMGLQDCQGFRLLNPDLRR